MRRNLIIIISAVIFIAAVTYVIKESETISILQSLLPEKIAVFKNVHMSGIEASSEAWDIYAKEAWTGRDKFITSFDHVTNATINKNGRIMIKGLVARRARISKNKDFEIFRSVDEDKNDRYLRVKVDFGALASPPKKEKKFSTLTADYIRFNPDSKKALVQGNIRIVKDKLTVRGEKATLDLNMNIATFEERSSFTKGESKLYSNSATAFFDTDKVDLSGSVEVEQKNKKASSEAANYDDNSKTIIMTGNVIAVIEKPKSMMKEESAKKYDNEETKTALVTRTSIKCDRLIIDTESNDAQAFGSVYVFQTSKEAKSEAAIYSEENENIVMTGNVYLKKNDDWIKADKVIVSVNKEMFEAIGGVETTFKVKKGSR